MFCIGPFESILITRSNRGDEVNGSYRVREEVSSIDLGDYIE